MREHDHFEWMPRTRHAVNAPDRIFQLGEPDELPRGQRSDGDHELRPQHGDLAIEVNAAVCDFKRAGNAIPTSLCIPAGKASDHGGDIHTLAELFLTDSQEAGEPGKEPFSGGVREGTAKVLFPRAWSLTDEHHAGVFHGSGDRPSGDARA